MQKNEYIDILKQIFAINGLGEPSDGVCESFYSLGEHLSTANKIHNLTAIKDDEEVIVKHFADSLLISESIPEKASLIDVGCGPGFPSLPIAIYRPDLKILGIDSTAKKINYVNETARSLGLSNIEALSTRAEELSHQDARESFDVATARAVASLPVLCELCLPFVKVGGLFVAMKAQSADEELEASKNAIEKCGGKLIETKRHELCHRSGLKEARNIIIIKKVKQTPDIYPRLYSKITKKPL